MNDRKPVLRVGRRTFPLGTGIRKGWMDAKHWFDDSENSSFEDIKWRESKYRCNDCNEDLQIASVPCPFFFDIYICVNGHKFCYENTD